MNSRNPALAAIVFILIACSGPASATDYAPQAQRFIPQAPPAPVAERFIPQAPVAPAASTYYPYADQAPQASPAAAQPNYVAPAAFIPPQSGTIPMAPTAASPEMAPTADRYIPQAPSAPVAQRFQP